MSKASSAGNAVVNAAVEACALYRVGCIRMQSRVFQVTGIGGRQRPMFMGGWTDNFGVKHSGGMADLLAMPLILISSPQQWATYVTVPLWVECKAGSGRQTPDQIAFEKYVTECGAFYLLLRDSADGLIDWFKKYGVKRNEYR